MKQLKKIIYTRGCNLLLDGFVRIYSKTFRFKITGEDQWQRMLEKKIPVVLCCWHQQVFALIARGAAYRAYRPAVMISKSRDGDLVAPFSLRRGCRSIRGSSSRGGKEALDQLIAHVQEYGFAFHVLDGPTGPMGKVKPGAIKLAKQTGAALFPVQLKADQAWFFGSWDHFMLPKPFSRVEILFGDPIRLSEDMRSQAFDQDRQLLEKTMHPYLVWPENPDS